MAAVAAIMHPRSVTRRLCLDIVLILVVEDRMAGEIEATDENPRIAVERAGRRNAEAARDDPPRALRSAERTDAFLPQIVHRAVIGAAGGEQPFLAFEDYRQIGRQIVAGAPLMHRTHAEHEPHAAAVAVRGAGEADTHAAAVGTRAALALDLGIAPIDVEIERAAYAGSQVAVAARQAPVCGVIRRGDRRAGRRRARASASWRECHERQGAEQGGAVPGHWQQCTARQAGQW